MPEMKCICGNFQLGERLEANGMVRCLNCHGLMSWRNIEESRTRMFVIRKKDKKVIGTCSVFCIGKGLRQAVITNARTTTSYFYKFIFHNERLAVQAYGLRDASILPGWSPA